jgi:glyoxylase-like metal-dependent hydrolase (beta-lactamase superfamily II)
VLPDIQRLEGGISVIPLPLPFASPAWVNAYTIETSDGTVLIDCGVDWEPGRERLFEGLGVLGIPPGSIHTLVASHLHPDHVGMAPHLIETLGCRLLMHRSALTNTEFYNDTPRLAAWTSAFGHAHGVPASELVEFGDMIRPEWMPILSAPTLLVDDGDTIELGGGRHLEVLHTPGHDHSHICLRDSATGACFSGDHLLPRITPVIMWDESELDVLRLYLDSLERLVVAHIELTYPAHGSIFERGSERAGQIVLHHDRRLATMVEILSPGPATAWTVMGEAFRPHLNTLEKRLALRETVSHLEHLRLRHRLEADDREGVRWYRHTGHLLV